MFESPEKTIGERKLLFTNLNDVKDAQNEVHTPVKSPTKMSRVFSSIKKLFTSGKKSAERRSPVKIFLDRIEKRIE